MSRARILVGVLSLSAGALVALVTSEDYTGGAIIPTRNDRPTIGHGSTSWEDGTPVRMGDKMTPVRAIRLASHHISQEENIFRASIPGVALHQAEYDLYVDWLYQYGTGRWSTSSMRRELRAGNYGSACQALLLYKKSGGFDCSIPGNRICSGVWTRQLERHKKCMEAQ